MVEIISLGDNKLTGTIPPEIGLMTNLSTPYACLVAVTFSVISQAYPHLPFTLSFCRLFQSWQQQLDGHNPVRDWFTDQLG